jgi:hypothetical protein
LQLQLLQQECDWCAGAYVCWCAAAVTRILVLTECALGVTQSVYLVPLLDKGCSMQAAFFGTVHLRTRLLAVQQLLQCHLLGSKLCWRHVACVLAACCGG